MPEKPASIRLGVRVFCVLFGIGMLLTFIRFGGDWFNKPTAPHLVRLNIGEEVVYNEDPILKDLFTDKEGHELDNSHSYKIKSPNFITVEPFDVMTQDLYTDGQRTPKSAFKVRFRATKDADIGDHNILIEFPSGHVEKFICTVSSRKPGAD